MTTIPFDKCRQISAVSLSFAETSIPDEPFRQEYIDANYDYLIEQLFMKFGIKVIKRDIISEYHSAMWAYNLRWRPATTDCNVALWGGGLRGTRYRARDIFSDVNAIPPRRSSVFVDDIDGPIKPLTYNTYRLEGWDDLRDIWKFKKI